MFSYGSHSRHDKTVRVLELKTGMALHTPKGHKETAQAMVIMGDGAYAVRSFG